MDSIESTAYAPELIYTADGWQTGVALVCGTDGRIKRLARVDEVTGKITRLPNRALLPGMVNAHSHSFQRVIRGRTEYRSHSSDSFWTWRELMYSAANRLSPDDVYDAARMAFLEMALNGITSVGEFHYLHHAADGARYDDPNLLGKTVIRAANDVGIRIALLRVAYFRAGFEQPPNPLQRRFISADVDQFLTDTTALRKDVGANTAAWVGVAPHSIRAAHIDQIASIAGYADAFKLPVHMHIAEQPAEIEACQREYGQTPVEVLSNLINDHFTGVHAIHISDAEVQLLAAKGANICACPTTERNLGDGIIPADKLLNSGVSVSLGSDSHAQIDMFEEARELEYHLRLQRLQRNVLASSEPGADALAYRLFSCATAGGARSLAFNGGVLAPGRPADFFTVALEDPAIAGAGTDALLANIIFAAGREAVRDVWMGGYNVIENGRHTEQDEIVRRFGALQAKLWS